MQHHYAKVAYLLGKKVINIVCAFFSVSHHYAKVASPLEIKFNNIECAFFVVSCHYAKVHFHLEKENKSTTLSVPSSY